MKKKYMVVCVTITPDDIWTKFFDSEVEARGYMLHAECGLGAIVELYERTVENGFQLVCS